MPRPRHVKSNEEVQEEFKKAVLEKVKAILAQRDPQDSKPVALLSQDEGICGRINPPRACGAPEGMRPKVPRQIARAYVYVYTPTTRLVKFGLQFSLEPVILRNMT